MPVAESTGFRAETVEKVLHLLKLLDALNSHPFLKGKWVLKGGTALNMFMLDLPRLSVDIDLNYIGMLNREGMLMDRPKFDFLSARGVPVQEYPGSRPARTGSRQARGPNGTRASEGSVRLLPDS